LLTTQGGVVEFKRQATLVRKHGAAVVVMAFDEYGQAADEQSKVDICKRSYDILVQEVISQRVEIVFVAIPPHHVLYCVT
jgi:5-methyltetrahydrofolate--homocysteine methyltransferase